MTTIAANHEVMASDSKITMETKTDARTYTASKLVVKMGSIIGTAGSVDLCDKFIAWYGTKKKKPNFPKDADFEGLVLTHEGTLIHFDETLARNVVRDGFFAVGSGGHAALAVLHLGHDPIRAVEIACLVDPFSGPPVQVMRRTELGLQPDSATP